MRLFGEGDFALTDVKEMDGTPGFLVLDVGVKKCQNMETVLECWEEELYMSSVFRHTSSKELRTEVH